MPKIKLFKCQTLRKIKSINLYYTDYPKGRNLDKLNTNRINNLISAYEEVLDSNIVWTVNRQMACKNMQEANKMFHGFEIVLDIMKSKDLAYYHLQKGEQESIVEEVFERNEWDSMLVVADFTGSMSAYISQLLLWVKLNNKEGKEGRKFVGYDEKIMTMLNEFIIMRVMDVSFDIHF